VRSAWHWAGGAECVALARELVGVGLAELLEFGYLRLDPALAPVLLGEMSAEEREAARAAWAQAMAAMVDFLYQQRAKDANLAGNLALLELPNLLAALEYLREIAAPDAWSVWRPASKRSLRSGRRSAGARGGYSGGGSAPAGAWGHARFEAERAAIERLLEQGRNGEAVDRREIAARQGAGSRRERL